MTVPQRTALPVSYCCTRARTTGMLPPVKRRSTAAKVLFAFVVALVAAATGAAIMVATSDGHVTIALVIAVVAAAFLCRIGC